jgi:uncharacterized cupin superfamily protein
MVPEAPLEPADAGKVPAGEGWYVLNSKDARWLDGPFGAYTRFEDMRSPHLGFNIGVIEPGQPASLYHGEDNQENFLVLQGECVLLVEGQERRLKQWDFVHCPPWTEHVFVGAGDGPCAIIAVGTRHSRETIYPVSELAQRHGAGVKVQTSDPKQAYAGNEPDVAVEFRDDWLP